MKKELIRLVPIDMDDMQKVADGEMTVDEYMKKYDGYRPIMSEEEYENTEINKRFGSLVK